MTLSHKSAELPGEAIRLKKLPILPTNGAASLWMLRRFSTSFYRNLSSKAELVRCALNRLPAKVGDQKADLWRIDCGKEREEIQLFPPKACANRWVYR